MAVELIEQYVDREAFASDTNFIKSQLKEVADAYTNLAKQRVSLSYSDASKKVTEQLKSSNAALEKAVRLNNQVATTVLKTR
ncbi:hypothetical protein [Flavihumibacter sp. CACIAM 22H1]|uniref:hypothetical protein n=1 Tax=Flavihumibacter sp. CACIAM 22H1 TaxID=1812911 RepID=UPI0007A8D92E|nr:hypothetical protein [Flavihumibacter sp. CACIAM 22H1]KYP16636.1 MAG: hypothetical protein A1D16_09495 [Flavihumibacter sp. CACIAM 22H1]